MHTTSTSSNSDIPLEILYIIVHEFRRDTQTLKALALVSPSFLLICRKFLFSKIRLNCLNPSFNRRRDRLYTLFQRNPDLFSTVRELELGPAIFRMNSNPVANFHTSHWTSVHRRQAPTIDSSRVKYLLLNATQLRTLTLRFEFQDWNHCSSSFRDIVTKLILQDTLTTLRIEDVANFPMGLLAKSRSLKHLSLAFVAQHGAPSNTEHSSQVPAMNGNLDSPKRSHLETLTLYESDDCVVPLLSSTQSPESRMDLTLLKRLSVNTTGIDGRAALQRIPIVAKTIKILEIRAAHKNTTNSFSFLRLEDFPALRTLLFNLPFPVQSTFTDIRRLILQGNVSHKSSSSSSPPPTSPVCPNLTELKLFFRKIRDEESWSYMLSPKMECHWDLLNPLKLKKRLPALRTTSWRVSPRQVQVLQDASPCLVDALVESSWSRMESMYMEVQEDRFEPYAPCHI